MSWIAALALAVSLLAGCGDKKDRSPAPAPAAPAAPSPQAAPAAPAPAPAGGSQPAAPAAPAGPEVSAAEAVRRLTELADKICACPDRACADATHATFQQENARMAARMRGQPAPAEVAALQEQARRFSACVQKLP
jgi:hypothetical protein